jgi:hypothetical protein
MSTEENKPLIPPSTVFLLVTDSTLLPADAADTSGQKGTANILYQGYFDRPETARAFQQQQNIETPVFTAIPLEDAVGSRLRARTGDEVCFSFRNYIFTSDWTHRTVWIPVMAHI